MRLLLRKWAEKRMLELILKWILNTDTYYTMEGIMTSLGRGGRPGLAGAAGKDTSLTSWKENTLV
jgi:hypothetical protein